MRLIDSDPLYERACDLEAQALSYVGKIGNDEAMKEEWRIWSAILTERTAFKHDIFDAPTIEQKYTNKELRVFMHGISMRLLSLRSAQHWQYDDETAEEIKFLERLYKKVESEVTQ